MNIIDRYLGRTILRFIFMVLVVVVGIELFIFLVGEFGDVGKGNYGIGHAFLYALMVIPGQVYQLFPMVGLLGCLIGLGLLAQHSELIIMRAAGMPLWAITRIILYVAFAITLLVTVLGETAAPIMTKWANQMKLVATTSGQSLATRHGIWLRDQNDFIYVGDALPNMQLKDLTIYQFSDSRHLETAMHVGSAKSVGLNRWDIHDVHESLMGKKNVTTKKLPDQVISLSLNTHLAGRGTNFASQVPLWDLYFDIKHQEKAGMDSANFELNFWQRVAQPIAALVMILLAVPFIFGPLRSVSMGLRIVTGASVGFAFYLLNQFFGPFCLVYQIPPFIGAFLPTVLFAALGIFLLSRAR